MDPGEIVSIHMASEAEAGMRSLQKAHAVAGRGLKGDRYFDQMGTYSRHQGSDRQLTLIEWEALEALGRDYDTELDPGDARRNLVTRGVC